LIRFFHIYVHGKMLTIDLTTEPSRWRPLYVASLTEDPSVNFAAEDAQTAITLLIGHLQRSPRWRPPLERAC
jgi:hypothetical protein